MVWTDWSTLSDLFHVAHNLTNVQTGYLVSVTAVSTCCVHEVWYGGRCSDHGFLITCRCWGFLLEMTSDHFFFILYTIYISVCCYCNLCCKVKCTLVQALRLCTGCMAYRGSRCIFLPFHDHGTRRGWGVSFTTWPLFTRGKDPVPIVQEAGWGPMAGLVRRGKSRPHRDSIPGPSSP
jgi:hypothetical protein